MLPGAPGYALVVATNQAGMARGYDDEAAVARVHRRLRALLAAGVTPLFVTTGAGGRPPAAGRGGGVPEPGGGGRRRPRGTERARPAPAVTGRAWPGCRLVAERRRASGRHLQRPGRIAPPAPRAPFLPLLPCPPVGSGGLLLDLRRYLP
jgi:hypothetical protein